MSGPRVSAYVSKHPALDQLAQGLIALRHDVKWHKELDTGQKAQVMHDAVQGYFQKDRSPASLRITSKHLARLAMYIYGRDDHLKALYLKASELYIVAARALEA